MEIRLVAMEEQLRAVKASSPKQAALHVPRVQTMELNVALPRHAEIRQEAMGVPSPAAVVLLLRHPVLRAHCVLMMGLNVVSQ